MFRGGVSGSVETVLTVSVDDGLLLRHAIGQSAMDTSASQWSGRSRLRRSRHRAGRVNVRYKFLLLACFELRLSLSRR